LLVASRVALLAILLVVPGAVGDVNVIARDSCGRSLVGRFGGQFAVHF
jgi:hypothetical protein